MSTSKDVAKLAGVSVSAVSRAFRDDTYISKEKKERIMAAAEKLGYTPNLLARGLKSHRSKLIGLLHSDVDNPFLSTMTRVIEQELRRRGYRLIISHSNEDGSLEADNLSVFSGNRVDGIIFTPISEKNKQLVQQLHKRGVFMMQMYRTMYSYLDSVVVDDVEGAYLATKHLLAHGHRKILLFNVFNPYGPDRLQGYLKAYQELGIPVSEDYVVSLPYGKDTIVIAESFERLAPTAVIAGTNPIGKEMFMYAKERGLRVPEDFSLIVFDDVHWTPMLDITAIQQPLEYLSLSACRAIIDRIEGNMDNTDSINLSIRPTLIERKSVKDIRGDLA
jgi:DNA-binding LacI/PurR family transcriptional regulator